jgi:hypothetical protein
MSAVPRTYFWELSLEGIETMAKLRDIAQLIRSKNAGPFTLTFDVMFDRFEDYCRVRDSGAISRSIFSRLYGTPEEDVEIYSVDAARGIKITIPRPITQGDLEDPDMHGCQLFGPLVDIEIPD